MAVTEQQTATPPSHDADAEEEVLGALLLAAGIGVPILPRVNVTGIKPTDFARGTHRHIYRAIERLHDAGEPHTAGLVAAELERSGLLQEVGGRERLRELDTLAPSIYAAPANAARVVEQARRRRLHRIANEVAAAALAGTGTVDELAATFRDAFDADNPTASLTVETWHQFESQAHDQIPVLIDRIWPEAAFGFIAAPPKKGKTWIALALAVSLATGRPFLGEYAIPTARPVLYVALEGHRAALRARVGAIARGLDVDPDSDELDNLHWLYKPPGINLADIAWARRLHNAADKVDAALTIVDVLRAGARIKENDQEAFTNLRHNLQPINDAGRSIALLHHNIKLSEISRERDPGERMSGSGAMYGALDAAIYITGSEDHATRLRLDFDLRDLATPDTIHVQLTGDRNDNGGYGYKDTAAFQIVEETVHEDDLDASAQEIRDYVEEQGGDVKGIEIRGHFGISSDTLTRRIGTLQRLGVTYIGGQGKASRLIIKPPADPPKVSAQLEFPHAETFSGAETFPHNHAPLPEVSAPFRTTDVRNTESTDLQGKKFPHDSAPYGRASTPAATGTPDATTDDDFTTDPPTREEPA